MQFLRGVGVAAAHGRASASGAARPDTSRMCASSIRTARFAPRALAPGLASFAPRACAPGLASAGRRSRRSADTQFDGCTAGGRAGQPGWQGGSQLGQAVHTAHVRAITGAGRIPRPPTAGMPTCRAAQPTSVMWACRPTAPGRARHAHARPVLRSPRHVRAERDLDGGGVDAVDRWSGGLFQGQIEDVVDFFMFVRCHHEGPCSGRCSYLTPVVPAAVGIMVVVRCSGRGCMWPAVSGASTGAVIRDQY